MTKNNRINAIQIKMNYSLVDADNTAHKKAINLAKKLGRIPCLDIITIKQIIIITTI